MPERKYKYITILDAAKWRWRSDPNKGDEWIEEHAEKGYNAKYLHELGLDILGGCIICGAMLGAYNASPSYSGYWKCADGCIDDDGFSSESEFWDWIERQADEFNCEGDKDEY